MDQIYEDFKDKDVEFYTVYGQEPHAGEKVRNYDFSEYKQAASLEDREDYAKVLIEKWGQKRPILIDTVYKESLQYTIGGWSPNSLVVIDKEGKIALFQQWSNVDWLRGVLTGMTKDSQ